MDTISKTEPQSPHTLSSERFGTLTLDSNGACVSEIRLRQTDGSLSAQNLLCTHASEFPDWARHGGSHLKLKDGRHLESRYSRTHRVESSEGRIEVRNITLCDPDGTSAGVTEHWVFESDAERGLIWSVERQVETPLEIDYEGGPALFFNIRANRTPTMSGQKRLNPAGHGVAASWWVQTGHQRVRYLSDYDARPRGHNLEIYFPEHNESRLTSAEDWAIAKLYTTQSDDVDLRLSTLGNGTLYRRGSYNGFTEFGVSGDDESRLDAGTRTFTLNLQTRPRHQTGRQLKVTLPDKTLQNTASSWFGSMANGACLADNYHHLLGNQTDGFLYIGIPVFHAPALLASCSEPAPLSSHSLDYREAFLKYLEFNMRFVSPKGDIQFGFRHGGLDFIELSMTQLIGCEAYLLSSGDTAFARRWVHTFDALRGYLQSWLRNGLFYIPKNRIVSETGCTNWYYDSVPAHGYTFYHSLLYCRTLKALETIYLALEEEENAEEMQQSRYRLRELMRTRFWSPDAYGPGQGGFYDWITPEGKRKAYFFAINQYGAILNDIADRQQAQTLLHTADTRIAELQEKFHYTREATLDTLWPFAEEDRTVVDYIKGPNGDSFGTYMNGGSLLAVTCWETTARCKAGDADGALSLLKAFCRHAETSNWFEGDSAFAIDGTPCGWGGEPYLADGLCAVTSLVHGFLGVQFSWQDIQIRPALPRGWDSMSAEIEFKGQRWRITADEHQGWSKQRLDPAAETEKDVS